MSWRSLAAVAVVLLAGCNAIALGDTASRPTETLTPVPVETVEGAKTGTGPGTASPTDVHPGEAQAADRVGAIEQEGTAPAFSPPPGVSTDGSVDLSTLLAAHGAYLEAQGDSFTWVGRFELTVYDRNVSDRGYTRHLEVGGDAFLARHVAQHSQYTVSLYASSSTGYMKTVRTEGTEFEVVDDAWPPAQYLFAGDAVRQYLNGSDVSVDRISRDGETLYRLHTVRPGPGMDGISLRTTVSDYTATAYVTPAGLIRTMIVSYNRTVSGLTRHRYVRFDYSAVGETTVTRPDWVDQVRSNASGTASTASTATPASTFRTPTPTEANATTTATGRE